MSLGVVLFLECWCFRIVSVGGWIFCFAFDDFGGGLKFSF